MGASPSEPPRATVKPWPVEASSPRFQKLADRGHGLPRVGGEDQPPQRLEIVRAVLPGAQLRQQLANAGEHRGRGRGRKQAGTGAGRVAAVGAGLGAAAVAVETGVAVVTGAVSGRERRAFPINRQRPEEEDDPEREEDGVARSHRFAGAGPAAAYFRYV